MQRLYQGHTSYCSAALVSGSHESKAGALFTGPGGFPTLNWAPAAELCKCIPWTTCFWILWRILIKTWLLSPVESESLGTGPGALSGNQFLAVSYSDQCLRTSHLLGARILDSPPFEWKNKTISSSYQTIFTWMLTDNFSKKGALDHVKTCLVLPSN